MAQIKQGLEQKLQQKLSPLQIQTIKLIEMPVQALEQHVREVLNDNPVIDDAPAGGGESDEPRDMSISEMEDLSIYLLLQMWRASPHREIRLQKKVQFMFWRP